MSVYKWPKSVLNTCEKLIRNFLWSGDPNVKKLVTAKWDHVNAPVEEGGLGLRRLEVMNKAMLMKLLWKIETEDTEWALFMKAKYKTKDGAWISYYKQSSIWPGLKWIASEVQEGSRWIVGNGKSISVWKDKWIKDFSLWDRYAGDAYILQNLNLKVEDLILNGEWQLPRDMLNYFNIQDFPVIGGGNDRRIWSHDRTGIFTVSNAANVIRTKYPTVSWAKFVWNPCIHPYTSANLWKVLRGACATEETVRKKGFSTVSKCYLCENSHDTVDHILWSCSFSEDIWHWICSIFHCSLPTKFEDVIHTAKGRSSAIKEVWFNCAFNIMVQIWHTRNKRIYDEEVPSLAMFKQHIIRFVKECRIRMKGEMNGSLLDLQILLAFQITGVKTKTIIPKQCFFKFPSLNQILICCDGASKGNPGLAGFGFVARNHYGQCVGAASGGLGVATNYLAEVMALIVAGERAINKGFLNVCFSLDSQATLQAFSNNKVPWIVFNRWKKITQGIPAISLKHAFREVNFSADHMAKEGVAMRSGDIL